MIQGVVIRELRTHQDERGFFREILRASDAGFPGQFGQWSHSLMWDGVIKAWHMHRVQSDCWYVCSGVLKLGLCDLRTESPTYKTTVQFLLGDPTPARLVIIPPGVAHGCKVIQGPVNLLYLTSHTYDPADELRIPYDSPEIDFDWKAGPPIS